jgi:D-3-phosphoglycerate dehydrogenase
MRKILVTPRSVTRQGHPSLQRLEVHHFKVVFCRPGELPSEKDLTGMLPGCVGYLAGIEPISASVLEAAHGLRAISRNGTGIDGIDVAAAQRLGIQILRAQGANARGVAELTLTLALSLARGLAICDRSLKSGSWNRPMGFELEGKVLGLIGCGKIGRLVTGFATALGMKILAYDPMPEWSDAPHGFRFTTLYDVFQHSDIISLHCPPLPDGRPLFDQRAINNLKHGALVINTARGGLIDTEAMLEALESGQVTGLALDVFDEEPPQDRRLIEHPRVVATPHIGGYTTESIDRAMNMAVDNLLAVLVPG